MRAIDNRYTEALDFTTMYIADTYNRCVIPTFGDVFIAITGHLQQKQEWYDAIFPPYILDTT